MEANGVIVTSTVTEPIYPASHSMQCAINSFMFVLREIFSLIAFFNIQVLLVIRKARVYLLLGCYFNVWITLQLPGK